MALLSIIIPIYNAGGRLSKLLDSLCNQTLQDIEFICIIDSPTDGSDKIVVDYSMNDTRVIPIFNKMNMGIAASRNRGIQEAINRKSQYIGFADHDDYLETNAYEMMICAANDKNRGGADVVFANAIIERELDLREVYFNDSTWDGIIKSLLLPMESKGNPNYLARSVWNRIYKTSFIANNNIRFFDRNIYFEEDTLFNLQVHLKSKNVQYLNECVYHWVKYETSTSEIVGSHDNEAEKILTFLLQEWRILTRSEQHKFKVYFHVMLSSFLRRYYSVIKRKNNEYKHELAKLLRDSSFPILGRYENMKIISLIRIKLLLLVLRMKINM